MVIQVGTRELSWPGGSFRRIETPPGTVTRDVAFAYRLVGGRIAERWAIRDDLSMLIRLDASHRGGGVPGGFVQEGAAATAAGEVEAESAGGDRSAVAQSDKGPPVTVGQRSSACRQGNPRRTY
jgi:hypothetical protein